MADDGNVLLSWIADDAEDETRVPTDEIYGVILHTVTNAEALATREQTATMFYRYARFAGCDMTPSAALSRFRDGAEVADYAAEPMRWAIGAGLIKGMTADRLCPQESTTRAQLAALLRRFETIET